MSSENWYKIDKVAKVFLATVGKRDTRSFRLSCTLKEKIDPELYSRRSFRPYRTDRRYR